MRLKVWILVIECFFGVKLLAQSDSLSIKVKDTLPQTVQVKKTWNTDPLSPARAAFYSAILPGLGQAYNKSYWKIPIVYLAIGIPTYLYVVNDKDKKLRSKRLLALSDEKIQAFYATHIGQQAEVLFEKAARGKAMHGFTKNYIRVELPPSMAREEYDNQLIDVTLGEFNHDRSALKAIL